MHAESNVTSGEILIEWHGGGGGAEREAKRRKEKWGKFPVSTD